MKGIEQKFNTRKNNLQRQSNLTSLGDEASLKVSSLNIPQQAA
jgi:hypothetical protein